MWRGGERQVQSASFQNTNGILPGGEGGDAGHGDYSQLGGLRAKRAQPSIAWAQAGEPAINDTMVGGAFSLGVGASASGAQGRAVEVPVEPVPPQPHGGPSQPYERPVRRSARLSRVLVQATPAEQAQAEGSDGDPMYDNPELPNDTFYDSFEELVEVEVGENGNFEDGHGNVPSVVRLDANSTQHLFRKGIWLQSSNTFSPEPLPYSGGPSGLKHEYIRMPTYLHLFGLFWTHTVLNRICVETNRYAQEDDGGKPKRGQGDVEISHKEWC
jgi:hypothetical protein